MAARLLFAAAALGLLVLQIVLGRTLQVGGVSPDLYVLFVVYLVRVLPPGRALAAAWGLGLLRDCMTPAPLGLDAAALLAAAGLLVWAHRRFVLDTDIALAAMAGATGLVHGAVWACAMSLTETGGSFGVMFGRIAVPAALYAAVLMPPFARAAAAIERRLPSTRTYRLA